MLRCDFKFNGENETSSSPFPKIFPDHRLTQSFRLVKKRRNTVRLIVTYESCFNQKSNALQSALVMLTCPLRITHTFRFEVEPLDAFKKRSFPQLCTFEMTWVIKGKT